MDLPQRVMDLVAALTRGEGTSFMAERLQVDVEGARHDVDAAKTWLVTASKGEVAATVVGVKRNLTFVDWVWPGVGAGVAVLSWDQDGNVVHAMVQLRAKR